MMKESLDSYTSTIEAHLRENWRTDDEFRKLHLDAKNDAISEVSLSDRYNQIAIHFINSQFICPIQLVAKPEFADFDSSASLKHEFEFAIDNQFNALAMRNTEKRKAYEVSR